MGKLTGLAGMNPADQHRKKMHEREMQKNKETKKRMRETALLNKDTSKLEKKIERYRNIKRKLTDVECEKLQGLEAELKETLERQKEAGIEPRMRHHADDKAVGYDPLAGSEDHNALVEHESSSDGESIDSNIIGKEIHLGQEEYEQESVSPAAPNAPGIDAEWKGSLSLGREYDALADAQFPPMPAGTPPLLPEDVNIDEDWPLAPSGPSPQFEAHLNPQSNGYGAQGRGRHYTNNNRGRGGSEWRGRGRGRGNTNYHPYGRGPAQPIPIGQGQFPSQPPPIPPLGAHIQNPPQYRPRPVPSSGTVLAAEPQVRDLKKELTTLVPSAIARKNKQSDRQRVLEAVPLAPQMVINAAPDVGIDPAGPVATASSRNNTATSTSIIENIQPLAGMSFNAAPDLSKSEPGPPKKEGSNKSKPDSLDDQYQKFVSQMDNLL